MPLKQMRAKRSSPRNRSFPMEHVDPSNTPIPRPTNPRPTPITTPNGIWIHSAILPQYTFQTDRPTHRATEGIDDRSIP